MIFFIEVCFLLQIPFIYYHLLDFWSVSLSVMKYSFAIKKENLFTTITVLVDYKERRVKGRIRGCVFHRIFTHTDDGLGYLRVNDCPAGLNLPAGGLK